MGMSDESKKSESKLSVEKIPLSDYPIEAGDSSTPLVLDLPDGQKIMVGQLDPGTIIEVATWRGTGRPDSRTNRLMLGVSHDGNESISESGDENSEGGRYIKTGVNRELLQPGSATESTSEGKKVQRKFTFFRSKGFLQTVSTLVVLAAIVAFGGIAGFRFEHPHSGASTALGSARSSVVLVHRSHTYHVGDKIVAGISPKKSSPVLGLVSAASGENLLISSKAGSQQSTTNKVSGRVLLIIPGLGFILNAIGL